MKIKDIFSKLFRRPTHTENLISFAETRPAIICPAQECQLPEYIKSVDNGLDINYNIFNKKEENVMHIDTEKARAYFENVKQQRDQAVNNALLGLNGKVDEFIRAEIARLKPIAEEQIKAELIAQAEEPFKHDLELFEKLKIVTQAEETVEPTEINDLAVNNQEI